MKKKITHISDTHNKHNQLNGLLPGGDLLIHSGDISSLGRQSEVERFVKWFNGIDNYTYKIFIAGNHDMSFDSEKLMQTKIDYFDGKRSVWETEGNTHTPSDGKPQWLIDLLDVGLAGGVFYLENSSIDIEGIKIWGSPITPSFGYGWAFNKDRGYDINEVWNTIPDGTDIVITHGPIHSYCDRTNREGLNVGCEQLYHRLNEIKPQLHFSGHIHEAYGYRHTNWGYAFNGCNCDLSYLVNNKPMAFEYDFLNKDIVEFLM
jgi:predicted MPP superfamily phosphohydrolase